MLKSDGGRRLTYTNSEYRPIYSDYMMYSYNEHLYFAVALVYRKKLST